MWWRNPPHAVFKNVCNLEIQTYPIFTAENVRFPDASGHLSSEMDWIRPCSLSNKQNTVSCCLTGHQIAIKCWFRRVESTSEEEPATARELVAFIQGRAMFVLAHRSCHEPLVRTLFGGATKVKRARDYDFEEKPRTKRHDPVDQRISNSSDSPVLQSSL